MAASENIFFISKLFKNIFEFFLRGIDAALRVTSIPHGFRVVCQFVVETFEGRFSGENIVTHVLTTKLIIIVTF